MGVFRPMTNEYLCNNEEKTTEQSRVGKSMLTSVPSTGVILSHL